MKQYTYQSNPVEIEGNLSKAAERLLENSEENIFYQWSPERPTKISPGKVEFILENKPKSLTPDMIGEGGRIHGGLIMTAMDKAAILATHTTLESNEGAVTGKADFKFKNSTDTDIIIIATVSKEYGKIRPVQVEAYSTKNNEVDEKIATANIKTIVRNME